MWSHIFLFGIPLIKGAVLLSSLRFWREATAALVPGFLCQSGRRRPENVSILSSLITNAGQRWLGAEYYWPSAITTAPSLHAQRGAVVWQGYSWSISRCYETAFSKFYVALVKSSTRVCSTNHVYCADVVFTRLTVSIKKIFNMIGCKPPLFIA